MDATAYADHVIELHGGGIIMVGSDILDNSTFQLNLADGQIGR